MVYAQPHCPHSACSLFLVYHLYIYSLLDCKESPQNWPPTIQGFLAFGGNFHPLPKARTFSQGDADCREDPESRAPKKGFYSKQVFAQLFFTLNQV